MLLIICNKIWQTGEWSTPWTQSLIITLPKKGNLQLCQNYRTISLISHPSKVMLRILLNRLKPQAEEIIKEEQVGFRAGRSTTEQTFNLRILCEKYLQHQQSLYHVFVDFKKAFDRVWHAALWATMRLYNINDNLIRTIECLYNKATSAVYHDNNIGEWFRTTIGVRQGCLLSPTLFNIILERIMADALEDHEGTVSIGGRTITNLRFADDIDGLAGQKQELVKLVNHLEEASTAYGMQISAEKTQLMTNNTNGFITDITIDNKKLETVHSFKYLGAIVSDEGSKPEVRSWIAQTTAAVTKLKVIWNDKNIAISSKIRLMCSLAMSIFLYACETWTLCRHWKKDTGIGDELFPQTPWYLVQRSHNQWGSESQNWKRHRAVWRPPDYSEKTQTEVVRARHTIIWTGQDYPTGNSPRRKTKRQTEETMGRQHQRVDWPSMEHHTTESWEPRGVEEAGCKIYSGALTVSQTTG